MNKVIDNPVAPRYTSIDKEGVQFACIKIEEGEFKGIVYHYEQLQVGEEDEDGASLNFNYHIVEPVIAEEMMVDIFAETYLMNAARSINLKLITDKGIKLDSTLYKKFGIDSLQFVKSNAYYAGDLNGYLKLFEQVEARLASLEKEKDSLELKLVESAEAKIVQDSIDNEQGLIEAVQSDSN